MQLRVIVGFFVRFLLAYGLLMGLWPVVGGAYGAFFRSGGQVLFESFGSDGVVRFQEWSNNSGPYDTKLFVGKRQGDTQAWTPVSSRHIGYRSAALVAGLIVATPIAWRRRGRALFWGLLCVHGFVALRFAILIAEGLSPYRPGLQGSPESFWIRTMHAGTGLLSHGHALTYTVPVLIWVLVSLRREDLGMILNRHRGRPRKLREGKASVSSN